MCTSNRDYTCPKCGGWLEQMYGEMFHCDTCEYEIDFTPELKIEKIEIKPKKRKMEFGKIDVCSKCGQGLFGNEPWCEGGKRISLKQYTEDIRGEVFNEEKWSFISEESNNLTLLQKSELKNKNEEDHHTC